MLAVSSAWNAAAVGKWALRTVVLPTGAGAPPAATGANTASASSFLSSLMPWAKKASLPKGVARDGRSKRAGGMEPIREICEQTGCGEHTAAEYYEAEKFDINRAVSIEANQVVSLRITVIKEELLRHVRNLN